MRLLRLWGVLIGCAFGILSVCAGPVLAAKSSEEEVYRALDEFEQLRQESSQEMSRAVLRDRRLEEEADRKNSLEDPDRMRKIEIALQTTAFRHEAEANWPYYYQNNYPVANQVTKDGRLVGAYLSYTWHFRQGGSQSWGDIMKRSPVPDFVRLEADMSFGQISYNSYVSGKKDNKDAWEGNLRCLLGYDFPNSDGSFILSPYSGVGYRRFTDKAGSYVDYFVYDYVTYPVKSSYYYIPLGVEAKQRLNKDWDLSLKVEGDWIIFGGIEYYLSEIQGTFPGHDAITGEPLQLSPRNAISDMKGGFGGKTSFKVIKKQNAFNIFVEPFFDYWHFPATEPQQAHSYAVNNDTDYVSVYPNLQPYKPLFDPETNVKKYGVRVGLQF